MSGAWCWSCEAHGFLVQSHAVESFTHMYKLERQSPPSSMECGREQGGHTKPNLDHLHAESSAMHIVRCP